MFQTEASNLVMLLKLVKTLGPKLLENFGKEKVFFHCGTIFVFHPFRTDV